MSLPHTPAWPLCSLLLFSSPCPRVPQLLPSPPPCPPCCHFPFPAPAGVWEAPDPLRFLLAVFILPKSPLPFPTQGREGAAGTSRLTELLLPPSQGSTWTGPSRGICRSGGAELLGGARRWERRWWPRSSPSRPIPSPPPCPLTVPLPHPARSPPGRSPHRFWGSPASLPHSSWRSPGSPPPSPRPHRGRLSELGRAFVGRIGSIPPSL